LASILDIAPLSRVVKVRGTNIKVHELSNEYIVILVVRFPILKSVFQGAKFDGDTIAALGGELLGALVAAATGSLGDEKIEARARTLGLSATIQIVEALITLTVEGAGGIRPLVALIQRATASLTPPDAAAASPSDSASTPRKPRRN
jgi:hypothetical protein